MICSEGLRKELLEYNNIYKKFIFLVRIKHHLPMFEGVEVLDKTEAHRVESVVKVLAKLLFEKDYDS